MRHLKSILKSPLNFHRFSVFVTNLWICSIVPQQFSTSALRLRLGYWESWAKILHQDYTCCIPPWHKFFLWITGNLEPQKLSPWNKKSKRPNCTEKEGLHCPSLNCCQSDVHSGTLCLTSLLCRIVGQANLMKSYFHKNISH